MSEKTNSDAKTQQYQQNCDNSNNIKKSPATIPQKISMRLTVQSTTTMSHVLISASHIQHKNANNQSDGDGYNMVDDSMVTIETSTSIALIFKRNNWDLYQYSAGCADCQKLRIDLCLYQFNLTRGVVHSIITLTQQWELQVDLIGKIWDYYHQNV